MPKKNTTRSTQLAQKKIITKKLMAVSLKVDKYIYKQDPMSLLQAETYLQEVISYKASCLRDERSLQVIEKLTRCMKAIIIELKDNETTTESESLLEGNHVDRNVASPVYSLPEEDKTEMMEWTNDENKDTADDITVHTPNTIGDILTNPLDSSIEPIGQTQIEPLVSNLINLHNQTERNVDNELSKEIIDLTLNDDENDNSNALCSQSILNIEIEDIPHEVINSGMCGQDISHTENIQHDGTLTSTSFLNDTCGQDMSEVDKEIKKIMHIKEIVTNKINKNNVVSKESLIHVNNLKATEKITVTKPTENFKIQEVFDEISKSSKTNKTRKVLNKPNNVNKKKARKESNKENKKIKTKTSTQKTKNNKNIINNTKNKCKQLITSTDLKETCVLNDINTSKSHHNLKGDIPKRVEINIVDDFSWVENIRYVRQINVEEYDPKFNSIIDAFWDNCLLPENWNEGDFDY